MINGAIKSVGSLSATLAHVDPSLMAAKFRDFRGVVTEFSVASGRGVDQVKASFASLSKQTLLPDTQVAAFSQTIAKATYDFKDSGKALLALRAEGVATGRALEEMAPIAETLHNVFGESFDEMPSTLGDIRSAAETLGTSGGPAALQDQIASLGGMLSEVSIKGQKDAKGLVDVLASFGKGLRPEQKKRVQQELLSTFVQGGEQLRRNLRIKTEDFYDENGSIKFNAENLKRLRDYNLKQSGGNVAEARRRSALRHGGMYAAALYDSDLDTNLDKAASGTLSGNADKALTELMSSKHGVETGAEQQRDQRAREETGAIVNAIQQGFVAAMPGNSLLRAFGGPIAGGVAGIGANAVLGKLVTAPLELAMQSLSQKMYAVKIETLADGTQQASKALTSFGSVAQGVAGGLAALGIGYSIGTALDKQYDISGGLEGGAHILTSKDEDLNEEDRAAKHSAWDIAKGLFSGNVGEVVADKTKQHVSEKAKELAAQNAKKDQQVKIVIQNMTGMPLNVVNAEKGNAGRQ